MFKLSFIIDELFEWFVSLKSMIDTFNIYFLFVKLSDNFFNLNFIVVIPVLFITYVE